MKTKGPRKEQTTFLRMKRQGGSVISKMKSNIIKLLVIVNIFFYIDVSGTYSGAIRIGVVMDHSSKSMEILAALEFALQVAGDYNYDNSKITIDKIVNFTDVSDGYALSDLNEPSNRLSTSKYIFHDGTGYGAGHAHPSRAPDLPSNISEMCWQMEQMVFALFGLSHPVTYNVIQSYSRSLQMPWMTANPTRSSTFEPYSFQISMCPTFVDVVADFIKYFQWKKIYYLYDSDDGLWRLQRLFEAFRPPSRTLAIDARQIKDAWDVYDLLRQLDRSDPYFERRIVLDLSSKEAYSSFMTQVIDVGMNRDGYHYILGYLSITDLDLNVFQHGGVNITGFQLIDSSTDLVQTFYMKWRHSVGKDRMDSKIAPSLEAALTMDGIAVLTYALKNIWDNKKLRKIVFRTRRGQLFNTNEGGGLDCRANPVIPFLNGDIIVDAMKNATFNGISGHVQFDQHGQRDRYKLDVYQLQYKTQMRKVGFWTNQGLITNLTRPNDEVFRHTGDNITWSITTILEYPYVMKKHNDDGHPTEQYEGYIIDFAEKVSKIVKFKYHIHLVKDSKYGTQINGTWNGMIGELINNMSTCIFFTRHGMASSGRQRISYLVLISQTTSEGLQADMVMAPLTITREREKVVDFTKPFQNTGISIMIKKPEKQKPGVFSFKQPLSDQVWLCVTIGFFAVSLILTCVGRFSPYEWSEHDSKGPSNTFSLANTFWFSLGALMQQGSDISPRSASGRIAGCAWWFFTLILISSYTANLAAFLTVEKLLTPINSVDDLVGQTAIQYGILNSGSSYSFFNSSKVLVYEKMFKFMKETVPSVFVNSNQEGWKRVIAKKTKYAYLLESAFNDYFNQKIPCRTMKVGNNLDHKGYGIATRLGSELTSRLNLAVLELQENGELIKLEQRWWYEKGECGSVDSKDHSQRALTLSNVSGIFHILVAGLLTSMIVALFEYLINRKVQKSKKCQINNPKHNGTDKTPPRSDGTRSHSNYDEITVHNSQQSTPNAEMSYTT